jgi:dTDP-4-dehydrorhamnose 3,5-epimerase
MEIIKTGIPGLIILKPKIFEDSRGYFFESYNKGLLAEYGINPDFVQDNQSRSAYGVIRGLHYQLEPKAQTKLVRVLEGSIWDIAVDLREGSPTYLKWEGAELSAGNHLQLMIPKGFAHGFSVLSERAVVFYKCDELYSPDHEAGIRFDDPDIGIDWKIPEPDRILSERDTHMPSVHEARKNFRYQ